MTTQRNASRSGDPLESNTWVWKRENVKSQDGYRRSCVIGTVTLSHDQQHPLNYSTGLNGKKNIFLAAPSAQIQGNTDTYSGRMHTHGERARFQVKSQIPLKIIVNTSIALEICFSDKHAALGFLRHSTCALRSSTSESVSSPSLSQVHRTTHSYRLSKSLFPFSRGLRGVLRLSQLVRQKEKRITASIRISHVIKCMTYINSTTSGRAEILQT